MRESWAQPVAQEPVAWQYRMRADWVADWGLWQPCNLEQYEGYVRCPKLHDWHYEAMALYAAPVAQPVGEVTEVGVGGFHVVFNASLNVGDKLYAAPVMHKNAPELDTSQERVQKDGKLMHIIVQKNLLVEALKQ